MKVGIYSPYVDTLGGGERYLLTFAEYCLQRGWAVELFWKDRDIISLAKERFQLRLDGLTVNAAMYASFQPDASYLQKLIRMAKMPGYDLIFWLSDGSIPTLWGKQNWMHMQVPFVLTDNSLGHDRKLKRIQRVICNSQFTKHFIDQSLGIDSEVIYPPVAIHDFSQNVTEKENLILSVGRFDQILNSKRQDILITVFKNLIDNGLHGWKLVLAGGIQHNDSELIRLREMAMGYPIDFQINISHEDLITLYQKASIYWHAAGFGVDENKEPEKVEHFGISIVEAMAAGCIPVVYAAGGVKEIVEDKKNGYWWHNEKQLEKMTKNMTDNVMKEQEVTNAAKERALQFGKEAFFTELDKRLE